MINIAIFASGNGSNAQQIAEYFESSQYIRISRIYCNNPRAQVLERAGKLGIPTMLFDRTDFTKSTKVLDQLLSDQTDCITLAGFLWLVPQHILRNFHNRIVNIHPALLPKYGGKGMYGSKVHEEVIENGEAESGITIHYVNEKYDEGQIIFQAKCEVKPDETPESLASKVHELEYEYYPRIIEKLVFDQIEDL